MHWIMLHLVNQFLLLMSSEKQVGNVTIRSAHQTIRAKYSMTVKEEHVKPNLPVTVTECTASLL